MTKFNLVCVFVVAICFNSLLFAEHIAADNQSRGSIEQLVGRAYSLSTCDYKSQGGYSCLTCHRALHCYPGNAAILVDCYGVFRFCRDGRCSRFKGENCSPDTKLTTPGPIFNVTEPYYTDITANTGATAVEITKNASELSEIVTESVTPPIDSKDKTKSDVNSSTKSSVAKVSNSVNVGSNEV